MIGLQNKVVGDVFSASKVSSLDHVYFLCTWDMLILISIEYLITYNKNYLPLIKIKQCFSIFLLHNLFQSSFFGVCFLCVAYSGIWLKNFFLLLSVAVMFTLMWNSVWNHLFHTMRTQVYLGPHMIYSCKLMGILVTMVKTSLFLHFNIRWFFSFFTLYNRNFLTILWINFIPLLLVISLL